MIRSETRTVEDARTVDVGGTDPQIDRGVRARVEEILRSVLDEGDAAVLRLTAELDGWTPNAPADLVVDAGRCAEAWDALDPDLRESLALARDNIRSFHEQQKERGFIDIDPDGTVLGQRVLPLQRAGLYVPGGRAAYPSSVLMNAIPARVAGVEEVVMVTPTPGGTPNPVVLAAAHLAGVDRVVAIGGAQAVGALAYGTESIPAVDKIVGPGNRWVAEAKRQVYGRVDIDMIAGPSEILVIADDGADPRRVAADLIGQAEHDPDAVAWLVTTSEGLARTTPRAIAALLSANPRREIAARALEANGRIILVPDLETAAAVANRRAPEHLELLVGDPMALLGRIRNAGAVFLGDHSPEPMGDYIAGPNHVLPTGGTARWASPLGVYDFVKRTSIIGYSRARFEKHAPHVMRMAEAEDLAGHAAAVRVRLDTRGGEE